MPMGVLASNQFSDVRGSLMAVPAKPSRVPGETGGLTDCGTWSLEGIYQAGQVAQDCRAMKQCGGFKPNSQRWCTWSGSPMFDRG